MKVLSRETKLCLLCMEMHEVITLEITVHETVKGRKVSYPSVHEFCEDSDELLETEDMMRENARRRRGALD